VVKDNEDRTPLHWLARKEKVEVLKHKDVSVVEERRGVTPLHTLAFEGKVEVLSHKDVSIVKDNTNRTPLHWLAISIKVPRKWIKEKYPWFNLGEREINSELITEILNTQNACKFIEGIK